jgi:hypothetical protein
MCGEGGAIGQIGEITEESEALRVESGLQAFEEQATEQPGQWLDGQKEARALDIASAARLSIPAA